MDAEAANEQIKNQVKALPEQPGVYRYYDVEGNLLYIGKAKNLKKRVSSYFLNQERHSARIKLLVKRIYNIQFTLVDTEQDALLLENAMIKEHQPKYNIALKDDKSFPYIKIVKEPFPRIFFTRIYKNDGSEYFGPYTSFREVRLMLDLIKKIYPTRSCSLPLSKESIAKKKFRVCLEFHIGNCLGPCASHQSEQAYDANIREIKAMLKGKLGEVRQILKERMELAAQNLEFEVAEQYKIKIQSLKEYIDQTTIVNPGMGNLHIFGFYKDEKKAYINYLYVYAGTIIRTKNFTVQTKLDEDAEYILAYTIIDTLKDNYENEEIIVPFELKELPKEYKITIPKVGDKKKLAELSQKNAFQIKQNELKQNTGLSREERILQLMKSELRLKELPFLIECFDNSNFQGKFPVSAMVVFKNALPSKKDYRHYNIKTVEGPNDFASMEEVVYRRYKRLVEENEPLPQLIVIDGGKGQLASAIKSLQEVGIYEKVQVISIAKRLEEIYYPGDSVPLHINKKSETLKVLQHIRNEAHRFGITFHRNQRSKGSIKTGLTDIPGIGKTLSEKLLKSFGSINKIKEQSEEELSKVVGKAKASIIYNAFNQ